MIFRILLPIMILSVSAFAQAPPIEPGVSHELAQWRAVRYSNVRYKLNLTLEKMSPVLKGSMEIRLQYAAEACAECPPRFIVLDWRKIRGHEEKSTLSNVSINGRVAKLENHPVAEAATPLLRKEGSLAYREENEHLIFNDGVEMGENVIKLDFTSPILTSGSAITRYVDKEDGSEYLYSLFVPSDASTAFPVFDQPDIKARFRLELHVPYQWKVISNSEETDYRAIHEDPKPDSSGRPRLVAETFFFEETKPISTYVFAFAAGTWETVSEPPASAGGQSGDIGGTGTAPIWPAANAAGSDIYVRKSQAAKFKPHAAEVFRLNREAVKYFEGYFDYKFPFPKYDLVLIPEFPFGGMEHAGATFLREASIIFPQEPTKNDHISRATLIFHEAAHQWFGDTVTMRWFDDLWLKEGFATFTAYKALEKIMPEMNAWKVFYERVKQGAYATDSTRGTTAIYQPIVNLSAAKSAYGNIVYNKAPAFLRQAEFYLGEDKFQTAVRAFLKKHEFGNAGWEDLVKEFGRASGRADIEAWAERWVLQKGMPVVRASRYKDTSYCLEQSDILRDAASWPMKSKVLLRDAWGDGGNRIVDEELFTAPISDTPIRTPVDRIFRPRPLTICAYPLSHDAQPSVLFANYGDYGYGIFLLDEKSRDYVLKNIQNEKDPFLRSMMWGALWDSVREGELDPREYVELVVKVLSKSDAFTRSLAGTAEAVTLTEDESTTALLLNRVGTAMNYYIDEAGTQAPSPASARRAETTPTESLASRVEEMLIAGMRNSPTQGQRITYYRAFLNIASSEKARGVLKGMLASELTTPSAEAAATPPSKGGESRAKDGLTAETPRRREDKGQRDAGRSSHVIPLKTKDKLDIVARLLILNDPDAPKLLAELEKSETGDDAKRYAYAAKAGIPRAENKAKYWNDFVNNKEISESWIEAAFGPWNSIRHSELTLLYLERALMELPNHKRSRKIFFVNGWLGAFIGGQRSEEALGVVNKFLADNPNLDNDLRLKILENVDVIERAVRIRKKF